MAHGTRRQHHKTGQVHTNTHVSVNLTGREEPYVMQCERAGPAETSSSNPSSCVIPKRPYGERLCPALAQSEGAFETPVRKEQAS